MAQPRRSTESVSRKPFWRLLLLLCFLTAAWPAWAEGAEHDSAKGYDHDGKAILDDELLNRPQTGDLSDMIGRGTIRVLVSYNRTNFGFVPVKARGFEYDLMMQYREHLRSRVRKRSWPVQFVFIPMPFDELLPALIEGRGDIVASGLTITPERAESVAFTEPYMGGVDEVVVASPSAPPLATLDDLSGRKVFIRPGTSYEESLALLNADLAERGLPPAELVPANPVLAKEDVLEFVDQDLVEFTIVDSHLAGLWSHRFRQMRVYESLALRTGGQLAWAVRKDNPELLKSLNRFIETSGQGTLIGNVLLKRYFAEADWYASPLAKETLAEVAKVSDLLRLNGEKYGLDWRLLAALAYQESRFDHSVRSPAGAVGLMQVLPATAAAPPIELEAVDEIGINVEAGTKYLAFVRDEYFDDPAVPPAERINFALASYNAGPTRISRLRRLAAEQGLDGNLWIDNVEKLARRKIGLEPVQYVRNINRYYLAIALKDEAARTREAVRQDLQ